MIRRKYGNRTNTRRKTTASSRIIRGSTARRRCKGRRSTRYINRSGSHGEQNSSVARLGRAELGTICAIIGIIMTKPVILTGLRANNDLTIGNYFGGMLPIIEMASTQAGEYQINMFIPDLHSFTTPIDHEQLLDQVMHNARLYVAAGLSLDNEDILLYRQSYVPAHSELTWILDCFTGFGEMNRMTQFKDKSGNHDYIKMVRSVRAFIEETDKEGFIEQKEKVLSLFDAMSGSVSGLDFTSVGLFNYPVLMASDILLYGASYVPVGDDQTQHLEFTRDISERMNSRFGELFVVPEPVDKQHEFFGKGQGLRIKDLVDPTKKMSKSDESSRGVIFLTDSPEEAAKKVMSATTDDKASVNYDPIEQPGISNLLQILALLRSQPIDVVENEFKGRERYGDFKKVVADEVAAFLTDFQAKLDNVDDGAIMAAFERSEATANDQANETLYRVQQAIGLRPRS